MTWLRAVCVYSVQLDDDIVTSILATIMVQTHLPPIRIVRLSHMRYQHADLAKAKAFLEDFGMHVAYSEDGALYFAGKGPDPYVYVATSVS